jgi:hypothetical protein
MVTLEADLVCVESRLASGGIECPTCGNGVLGGWGYARMRRIAGVADLCGRDGRGVGSAW